MASNQKWSQMTNYAGGQIPTDLTCLSDVTNSVSKRSTLTDLFSEVTKNISDGALRMGGFTAPSVSAAGKNAIYFDSATNLTKLSENGGAFTNLIKGAGSNQQVPFYTTTSVLSGSAGLTFDSATRKLTIDSGTTNVAGLKLAQVNGSTPMVPGAPALGLDALGNVVVAATSAVSGFETGGRCAFWTGTSTISSDGGLLWDNTAKLLTATKFSLNGSQSLTSLTGTGAKLATGTGTYTSGNSVKIDANGNLVDGGAVYGGALSAAQGTITTNVPNLDGTATWNNSGVSFKAWRLNVTDTSSAAGSLLLDLQVGGISKFNVDKAGNATPTTVVIGQGTITSNTLNLDGSVTWNNAGVGFTAWRLNANDTASAAGSLLLDLQRNGGSQFQISKLGAIICGAGAATSGQCNVKSPSTTTPVAVLDTQASHNSDHTQWSFNGAVKMVLDKNNQLGIGVATALDLLHVSGGIARIDHTSNPGLDLYLSGTRKCLFRTSSGTDQIITGTSSGDLCFRIPSGSQFWSVDDGVTGLMKLNSTALTLKTTFTLASDGTPQQIILSQASTNNTGANFISRKSRGTNASPSAVSAADYIGALDFYAYTDGSNQYQRGAYFAAQVTSGSTVSSTSLAVDLIFATSPNGSVSPTERLRIPDKGGLVVGTAALATSATDGFLYVPSCAGTPTGTPTSRTGTVAIVMDTTNLKLYAYLSGAWKSVTLA